MPTLELPPESLPTPIPGTQLKDAFITFFSEIADMPEAGIFDVETRKSIETVTLATHQIATWDTPFAKTVPLCAKAYLDYFFERYGSEGIRDNRFVKLDERVALSKSYSEDVLTAAIRAYVFSGLIIQSATPMLDAAVAFEQDWEWVKEKIESGRQETVKALDVRHPRYRWNKKYVTSLGHDAINVLVPAVAMEAKQAISNT